MRFKPFVATSGSRYYGRLSVLGYGAEATMEVTADFEKPDQAVSELMVRLRHMFQPGDQIEVRGALFENVGDAEAELRASLP